MKKILFLIEDFRFGGVETSLINLLNSIDCKNKDYYITVLVWGDNDDVIDRLNRNSRIEVKKAKSCMAELLKKFGKLFIGKSKAEKFANKILRLKLLHIIQNENCDVIIRYHHSAFKTLFNRLKKKKGQKFITWYHRAVFADEYLNKEYTDPCDKVVVVSEGSREEILKEAPFLIDKMTVLENIIPYEEIKEKSETTDKMFCDKFANIVTCARISKEKGIDIAVNAAKMLKEKGLLFKWSIIGDEAETELGYTEKIQKLSADIKENFVLIGAKENPYPYFKQCYIYVQPSLEESYALTIAEAQVCGALVVSTDTVGARTFIKDGVTGVIAQINAEDVADKIRNIISDEKKFDEIKTNVEKIDFSLLNKQIEEKFYQLIDG